MIAGVDLWPTAETCADTVCWQTAEACADTVCWLVVVPPVRRAARWYVITGNEVIYEAGR